MRYTLYIYIYIYIYILLCQVIETFNRMAERWKSRGYTVVSLDYFQRLSNAPATISIKTGWEAIVHWDELAGDLLRLCVQLT